MSDTNEYTKSLEETVRKQEDIIDDLFKDRDRIVKMLQVLFQNTKDLEKDVELVYKPLNPGPSGSLEIIREAIKKKVIGELETQSHQIAAVFHYVAHDPSEYRVSLKHAAVPVISKLKGS